ncbi:MAG: hypothetical protein AMS22_09810 [Thiotrichales bacterium SG8_50]|nr:MAG: hypothetical protein AMS22_09810 [Thiotrichales bacterium SG8_50]
MQGSFIIEKNENGPVSYLATATVNGKTNRRQATTELAAYQWVMELFEPMDPTDPLEAIARLYTHATREPSGSYVCANYLLSLWKGNIYKMDLQNMMMVDRETFIDMVVVLRYLFNHGQSITSILSEDEMAVVQEQWASMTAMASEK